MILDRIAAALEAAGWPDWKPGPGERKAVRPLPGAAAAAVLAALSERPDSPPAVVAVTADPQEAEALASDLDFLLGEDDSRYFPQRETLPHEDADPHVEITGQRVETLAALLSGRGRLLVTTSRALVERTPIPSGGSSLGLSLEEGRRMRLAELVDRLERMGFERVHTVRELGEFAVRGGIVDLLPFGHERPLRVEMWGDEIASLRRFELLSQRSVGAAPAVEVLPVELRSGAPGEAPVERRSLLELLPERALLIELDPGGKRRRSRLWEEAVEARRPAEGSRREGVARAREILLPPDEAERRRSALARLALADEPNARALPISPPPSIEREMGRLVGEISAALDRDEEVVVLCDNRGQLDRLEEILEERAGPTLLRRVRLGLGSVSGGFHVEGRERLLLLADHEIFQRSRRLRRRGPGRGAATLESVTSLQPGDYVVHMDHGIGRYRGLERVEVGEEAIETLKIEYADGEVLRLPHYRLDLLEKWTGAPDEEGTVEPPQVHRLGGKRWQRLKRRTVESIQEMTAELLELYAHRQMAEGRAFGPETRWQREMEAAFLFDETPDQLAAWEDVRGDMEEPRPMDRLICGDVGFGKTEIAMRAAFKAVQDGAQVALLTPTTILAEQHLHTFRERLAGFPVSIEMLSRFRTAREQAETLERLADGRVDIVVGTHRLLSPDVAFRDLGLLVVDEEQRFGVRHKERLKELKRSIDVLTLTATPIPRTLQLALGGLRDLSLIETAPRDRQPIITHVLEWSDWVLQDAMRRELDRGGQVFFVHDRVQSIEAIAERVRSLLPEAAVEVAHGQLASSQLESRMEALMAGRVDVLVSTSIIENGLDISSANTMIVHRAERFGLAQLYQMRGRVGRSHHRAYCYLLVHPGVSPEAERRLRVLEHHTELGSGYQVALKDLQLRGAGNLLGASQSGFAHAVGFETYQRLLEQTVRRLRGEEPERVAEAAQVSVEGDAYLPDEYIGDGEVKMHLYRKVARAESAEAVEEIEEELRDRFGPLPPAASRLLASVRLKRLGGRIAAEWIRVGEDSARLNFRSSAVPRLTALRDAFAERQLDVDVRRVQPLSLVIRQIGVEPILPTLTAALELLAAAGSESTVPSH